VDTEGSELAILEGIDWSRYQFRCITMEYKFTKQRMGMNRIPSEKFHGNSSATSLCITGLAPRAQFELTQRSSLSKLKEKARLWRAFTIPKPAVQRGMRIFWPG
jgi:hypothetical protein